MHIIFGGNIIVSLRFNRSFKKNKINVTKYSLEKVKHGVWNFTGQLNFFPENLFKERERGKVIKRGSCSVGGNSDTVLQ